MRRTVATLLVLGIVWVGYTAWPLYDLLVLIRAIETRDARHVYFDRVRISLTNQVVAAYVRRAGIQISPLAQSMAASAFGIADPIVKKLVSPGARRCLHWQLVQSESGRDFLPFPTHSTKG